MATIAPVKLPNGTTVYLEVDEDARIEGPEGSEPTYSPGLPGIPVSRGSYREMDASGGETEEEMDEASRRAWQLTQTIQGIAAMIPEAFRSASVAEVEKLTLSFGIKVGGGMKVPFLAKAEGEANIGVVVECRYPGQGEGAAQTPQQNAEQEGKSV
jgi:hypothetical protein